jgi:hypothetical protein
VGPTDLDDNARVRILVVEDERKLAQVLASALKAETIARLESSFNQLRRFTADSSHELRTPLAVVRGIGEAAVAERRSPAEYEEAIGSMLEEIDRMSSLVDTLLRLSHGDAGTIRLSRQAIDLDQLARDVAASLGILAEERNQKVIVDASTQVTVRADRLVLREAVTNVLDNAIKYGPDVPRSRCESSGLAMKVCWRSPTRGLASPPSIAIASSIAFSESTKPAHASAAERVSVWPLRSGLWRSTEGGSPWTRRGTVAPSSAFICRSPSPHRRISSGERST